eukprot:13168967-Alexandrium_andersonii.AAC.1
MVRSKVLPSVLYGTPAAPVSRVALARTRTGIVSLLDQGAATNRSVDLGISASAPTELDPGVHVLVG